MLLKVNSEGIKEIKEITFTVFSDMPGKKKNIYLFHMLHKNGIKKGMCEEESGVTSTAYYRFRANKREELMESDRIIESILKFKETYG